MTPVLNPWRILPSAAPEAMRSPALRVGGIGLLPSLVVGAVIAQDVPSSSSTRLHRRKAAITDLVGRRSRYTISRGELTYTAPRG